jgi:hypothetical protein
MLPPKKGNPSPCEVGRGAYSVKLWLEAVTRNNKHLPYLFKSQAPSQTPKKRKLKN